METKELSMPIDETPVKLVVVGDSNLKEDHLENTNIEIENVSCQENIEDINNHVVQILSKTNMDKSESINHCDSFWVEPVANNELHEKIPNEDLSSKSSCKHNEKGVPDIIHISYQNSNADEFSSEIDPLENNHVNTPDENRFQADENANDTDLDQTFNLNGSYEISPNKIESSFEIVNRVIDCSELENDDVDEHEKEKDDPIEILNLEDQNYENKTIVFMQTTTTIIADIQTNVNEEESNIDQNNEENLTIIIPEELNKINFQDEEEEATEETDENEKQPSESEKNSSYAVKEVSKKTLMWLFGSNLKKFNFFILSRKFLRRKVTLVNVSNC